MTLTRTMRIRWTGPSGARNSAAVTCEQDPEETSEQFRDDTRRAAEDFARLCGWVPLAEERSLRRIARWFAGDRQ